MALAWTDEEKQANPLRRGFVEPTPSQHALQYADGTPCYLAGDTWWATATHRYPLYDDDTPRGLGPGMGLKDMVRFRKAQGYNLIAMIAAFPNWANDGHPARIDMEDGYLALSNHARVIHSTKWDGTVARLDQTNEYLKRNLESMNVEMAIAAHRYQK